MRFNSTIRINPTYPQALELINWAKTNKDMISGHASANFGGSSALTVNPVHQQIIPIAEITLATSAGVFCVEAEMSIAGDLQDFCVMECSGCKQKKRTKERKQFDCPKCQQKTTLVPRCTFQIDLIDASGTTTVSISGDLAEKLLSMTVEDIYDTTCMKCQVLRIEHAQEMLSGRLFRVQLRKSSWMNSNVAQSNLTILSYTEKEHVSPLSIGERNTKKAKSLGTSMEASAAENETLSSALSIEPSTAAKKL